MKITLIGDYCIDKWIYGTVTRINPEAPTPIFVSEYEETNMGMLGNVYENLQAFNPIGGGNEFRHDFSRLDQHAETKIRYVDKKSNYILFRNDIVKKQEKTSMKIGDSDLVIISDYNKGAVSEETIVRIIRESKGKVPVFIDTKKKLGFLDNIAKDNVFVKINEAEYNATKDDIDFDEMEYNLIITKGDRGADLYYNGINENFPGEKVEVANVCGAGDTFLAALSFHYVYNVSTKWFYYQTLQNSIQFANKCASIVVQRKGTAKLTYEDIKKLL